MTLSWKPLSEAPLIEERRVHVWKIDLNRSPAALDRLKPLLSPMELGKADRFYKQDDRRRYIAAHGGLREVLSRYLDCPAGALEFSVSEYGKPALSGKFSTSDLKFNLSHSHELALVAVTLSREIGVDIERVRTLKDRQKIAGRHFSPEERAMLESLKETARTTAFFRYWTRKEALLKFAGKGLSIPLDTWSVAANPAGNAQAMQISCLTDASVLCEITDLDPADGYVGACAVEGSGCVLARLEHTIDREIA